MRFITPLYVLNSERIYVSLNFIYPWRFIVSGSVELYYKISRFAISRLIVSQYLFKTVVGCVYGEHTYQLGLSFKLLTISSSFNISTEVILDDLEIVGKTAKRTVVTSIANDPTLYMPF